MTHFPFNVSILDDKILEEDENFILSIDPSSLPCCVTIGNYDQATVTILEDECKFIINIRTHVSQLDSITLIYVHNTKLRMHSF